ncbi:MAG: peptidylprolyl isomerase [Betaproteobacteria bacterium]|nr:peptidylprolyl isomerase [Betaproteobacteria bacterium]
MVFASTLPLVSADCVVSLRYRVTDTLGEVIAHSDTPETFLMGSDDLLPRIQQQLIGQAVGYSAQLHLEPEDAFGDYDAELVRVEPRAQFPAELAQGMQFEGLPDDDIEPGEARLYTVTDITDDAVVLDGNHPLAGIAVRFELTLMGIRRATDSEVEAGSALGGSDTEALRVLDKPLPPDGQLH